MIWRLWSILMVVLVGGTWLLAIPYSPDPILKAGTVIKEYREMGMVPGIGKTTVSKTLDHDVFEVPPEDEVELEKAMESVVSGASGGMAMPGVTGQSMPSVENQTMPVMKNQQMAEMPGNTMPGNTMPGNTMPGQTMPGQMMPGQMDKKMPTSAMEDAELSASGITVLAEGTASEIDMILAKKAIKVDQATVINMDEWNFGTNKTTVKAGEIVRIRVNNAGKIPHEFMIMDMPGMQAVSYRQLRADWNLLEHEALSEVSFLLPGDSAEMVIRVTKPGTWMYMCMFPYHMQLGMMGIMSTPGQPEAAPMKM